MRERKRGNGLYTQHLEKPSLRIATMALVASSYSIMTLVLGEFGYSWVQIRISVARIYQRFLMDFSAVAGLTIGCIIANVFSPVGLPDMVFGPLLTFFAATLSWKFNFNKRIVACIYPILVNAFGVSAYISSFYGVPYAMSVATVAFGEFIAAVLVGYPLLIAIERRLSRFKTMIDPSTGS